MLGLQALPLLPPECLFWTAATSPAHWIRRGTQGWAVHIAMLESAVLVSAVAEATPPWRRKGG